MENKHNLRYLLRAFEAADSCRVAKLVEFLSQGQMRLVSRSRIRDIWLSNWPHHRDQTGRGSISHRMRRGIGLLRAAGAIQTNEDGSVQIVDRELISMAAGNLDTVLDPDTGYAIPPSQWKRVPVVPQWLYETQRQLLARMGDYAGGLVFEQKDAKFLVHADARLWEVLTKVRERIESRGYPPADAFSDAFETWLFQEQANDEYRATEEGSALCGRQLPPEVVQAVQDAVADMPGWSGS